MDSGTIITILVLLYTCIFVFGPFFLLLIVSFLIFLLIVPRKSNEVVRRMREGESSIIYEGKAEITIRNYKWKKYPRIGEKMQVYFLPDKVFCVNYVELLGQYRFNTLLMELNFESHAEYRDSLIMPCKIISVDINNNDMVITFRGMLYGDSLKYDLTFHGIVSHSDFSRIVALIPEKYLEMENAQSKLTI